MRVDVYMLPQYDISLQGKLLRDDESSEMLDNSFNKTL